MKADIDSFESSSAAALDQLRSAASNPFGYDATQILRGISKAPTLRRILDPPQGRNGPCYTYWGDYAILYQQGQYLRDARIDRSGPMS